MHPSWRALYVLPWIVACFLLAWLCLTRVPLDGKRFLSIPFDGRSPWVNAFLPGQRTTALGPQEDGWVGQRITDEPVYTTLRLPGVYEQATVELEFRPHTQPLIEVGFTRDSSSDFAIQPFWSEILSKGWRRTNWKGREGYVREGEPDAALEEQDLNRLLVWHASTTVPALMDSVASDRTFATALRGSYDLHVVPVNGRISFRLQLQDMNRQREKGVVVFTLSKNGDLLSSEALSLAGSRDERPSEIYAKSLQFADLEPGVYKLSVIADDDIFTRQLQSPLSHWVIGPRLYFGDQVGYATTSLPGIAWSNAQHLQVETLHPEGKQRLTFGSAVVEVAALHHSYELSRLPAERDMPQVVHAPRGDIRIIGDGYFALAPELLFLPAPRRLTEASHPVEEGVRAILTSYIPPRPLEDGWYTSFHVYPLTARPGTLRLTLGAPGIREREASIDVRAFRLLYQRSALSSRDWLLAIWRELASAWRAL